MMLTRVLSFVWGLVPARLAMAVWRACPSAELPPAEAISPDFPALGKGSRWAVPDALAYHRHARGRPLLSQEDERLIRLVEIRKGAFFDGPSCVPAAILASALADMGARAGDLRATNTALKLRDLSASSLPPLSAVGRAYFRDADKALELALRRLRDTSR